MIDDAVSVCQMWINSGEDFGSLLELLSSEIFQSQLTFCLSIRRFRIFNKSVLTESTKKMFSRWQSLLRMKKRTEINPRSTNSLALRPKTVPLDVEIASDIPGVPEVSSRDFEVKKVCELWREKFFRDPASWLGLPLTASAINRAGWASNFVQSLRTFVFSKFRASIHQIVFFFFFF